MSVPASPPPSQGVLQSGSQPLSLWRRVSQFGAMLVGVPDYEGYVAHMRERHPELVPMTREQFVRSRMEARLGAKTPGKCPC